MGDLRDTAGQEVRDVARGRRWHTPFAVIGGVAGFVWGVAALIVAAALLVWILG
jgi:hypothetical protein